ncbi:unnamed protein product [Rotaria sp. Silwood1]|nr:unnamed protein product [Rotaria sp. Silwood1]
MPLISIAGKIIGRVFVCLQEPTEEIGPYVKQSIYQAGNIHVACSYFGKLTETHIQYWTKNVLSSSISEDGLLLLDSWPGSVKDRDRSGRPASATTEKITEIYEVFTATSVSSVRQISQEVNLSKSVVHRTMRSDLKYKPHTMHLTQKLYDEDQDLRVDACEL